MTRALCAALLCLVATTRLALAQGDTQAEVAVTAGASTQDLGGLAMQMRVFGEPTHNLRFFLEGAWADEHGQKSDAFGSAYPYDNRVQPIETYAEAMTDSPKLVLGVRGGRYRTPFGLYSRGDYAYNGFLRPPLIRYDNYFGLSNNFLEGGVNVIAGVPAVHAEFSVGAPQDVGDAVRPRGFDPVARVEGYVGDLILGMSYLRSHPYEHAFPVHGNLEFTGVDFRYMRKGVQLRGEWISGRPFAGATTTGWYVDGTVHRRELGPMMLVTRVEKLDYEAGRFSKYATRFTGGTRIELPRNFSAQIALSHQPGGYFGDTRSTALDVAINWVKRFALAK
jgi:hypothetical protein